MKIGSLWKRTTKDGKAFLSGVIEYPGVALHVAVFKNENKKRSEQPDYEISWRAERPEKEKGAPAPVDDDVSF